MPFCTYKGCQKKNIDQPMSEFVSAKGKRVKYCTRCRFISRSFKQREKMRSANGAIGAAVMTRLNSGREGKVGEPPRFVGDWHRSMYEGWLKELVGEVRAVS